MFALKATLVALSLALLESNARYCAFALPRTLLKLPAHTETEEVPAISPGQLQYAGAYLQRAKVSQTWICFWLAMNNTACTDGCCDTDLDRIELSVGTGCKGASTKAKLYSSDAINPGVDKALKDLSVSYIASASSAVLRIGNLQLTQSKLASYPDGLQMCINVVGGGFSSPVWPVCAPYEYFLTSSALGGPGVDYVISDKAKKCSASGAVSWPRPPISDDNEMPHH